MESKRRVAVIGSGNWGSTIGKIVAANVSNLSSFDKEVNMWVFEEIIDGTPLTDILNTSHENVKYLPGIKLPQNLRAISDLATCVDGADILIFVLPHQFLIKACDIIKPNLKKNAYGCSLIKGLAEASGGGLRLLTDLIREKIGIECACLMGANLATEVASEMFCEATVASLNEEHGKELKSIFQTPYFRITVIRDEVGTELCGALKNIVAIGAGIAEGLNYGDNTKAAVIRLGFMEMKKFIYEFFGEREPREGTFLESCGVADLITTCYGGRNRKVGVALASTDKNVGELEKELLGGQSAQGVLTAAEVFLMLSACNKTNIFPIFTTIHHICQRNISPKNFISCLQNHPIHD